MAISAAGDNLGNHIASQNIQLNNNWLSNDGENEGVFVSVAGNVGIGLSSPVFKFQVADSSTFSVDASDPDIVKFGNLSSSPDAVRLVSLGSVEINIDDNANSTGKYFRVMDSENELMQITESGNLGIGTSAPNNALHVEASIAGADAVVSSYIAQFTNTAATSSADGILIDL